VRGHDRRHEHEADGPRRPKSVDEIAAELIAVHRRRSGRRSDALEERGLSHHIAALLGPRDTHRSPIRPRDITSPSRPVHAALPPRPEATTDSDLYDGIRGAFERNEAWLRHNATAMDRIVAGMRADPREVDPGPVGPLQREVRLAVGPEGVGRGYFVLRNGGEVGRDVVIEQTRTRGLPSSSSRAPRLEISPAQLSLAPGEAREVGVRVDLAGCPIDARHEVELGLTARCGDDAWTVIWVVIVVEEEARHG